jgi:hypothetical protein
VVEESQLWSVDGNIGMRGMLVIGHDFDLIFSSFSRHYDHHNDFSGRGKTIVVEVDSIPK